MSKPNRFAKSLATIETNTNIDNQKREPVALPPLPKVEPDKTERDLVEQGTAALTEPVANHPDNKSIVKQSAEEKKSRTGKKFDVDGVLGSLNVEQRNGKSMTLYMRNDVLERLEILSKEKNISKSRIIHAILEQALLK